MATILGERWDSRKETIGWQNKKADLIILVTGTEDETEINAIGDAYAGTYATPYNLIFQNYEFEHFGGGVWELTVHFANRDPKNPGDSTYNFDTGGGTTKITSSYKTVTTLTTYTGGTAPNHHGTIGVTSDGIDGCDVVTPQFNFSETHYVPVSSVTDSYKGALFALTGQVNQAAWRNYQAGEVLFMGASGTQRGLDDWEITFKFQAQPNASGLAVGPFTITKNGWDYLWLSYIDQVDRTAVPVAMVKKPIAAYVEQVYQYGDFTTLGIGS